MQTRGNIFILHYSKLHEFPQIRLCFSSRLQVSLPQRDVTSGSSFPLLVQPVAGIQSWCVGKEQIKQEEEEVWKRPHNLGGETRMPPLSLCKIAFSFISNCFFLQGEFSKRLSQSLPVLVCHCIVLPELFKCFLVWMWGRLFQTGSAEIKYQKRLFVW